MCTVGLAACGDDDGDDSKGTGGSSGSGGSGGASTGGTAGSGTGGTAGSGTGGTAGSGTGGTAGSGTGGSGTGGSGTGGSGTGGSGGLSAGPGQFNYKGEVNGQSIAGNCTFKNNADKDSYVAGIAGNQLNVGCPGVIGTAIVNPGAFLILKSYAALPATFSYTKQDAGYGAKYELSGWSTYNGAKLGSANKNTESIDVTGTYDGPTKRVTANVKAKWGTPTNPTYEAQGWLEIAFDVTHP
jgi:hypothetical protein